MNRAMKKKAEHVLGILHEINDNQELVHPCTIKNCFDARLSDEGKHIISGHYVLYVYAFSELDVKWYLEEDGCYITMNQLRRIFENIWMTEKGLLQGHDVSPEFPNIRAKCVLKCNKCDLVNTIWRVKRLFGIAPSMYWRFEMSIREEDAK